MGKSETRTVKIINLLRDEITQGNLSPCAKLPEGLLAGKYGASRTPVRTALNFLAAEGLVEYRRNSGFAVRTVSHKDISDTFEVRASLEGAACRILAERGIPHAIRIALEESIANCASLFQRARQSKSAIDAYFTESKNFHTIIVEATQNDHLAAAIESTRQILLLGTGGEPSLKKDWRPGSEGFDGSSFVSKKAKVLSAMVVGDGTQAFSLMRALALSEFAASWGTW